MKRSNSEKEYEVLKTYFLREMDMMSELNFRRTLYELKDVATDTLIESKLLEKVNDKNLRITDLGISIVDTFTVICECGEEVFLNICSPMTVCPKCGEKIFTEDVFRFLVKGGMN